MNNGSIRQLIEVSLCLRSSHQPKKTVRDEAEECGARFIQIINEPMNNRYKPSGRDFDLCESGRMLIISANLPGSLSRQTCLAMNRVAEAIAGR